MNENVQPGTGALILKAIALFDIPVVVKYTLNERPSLLKYHFSVAELGVVYNHTIDGVQGHPLGYNRCSLV